MYLTAQRVRDRHGHEGTNAYYYHCGFDVWAPEHRPPRTPDADPGELVHHIITLPPPGNRVRSYLDVVAPDSTPAATIRRAFAIADGLVQPDRLPFWLDVTPCWFRFGAENPLAGMWRQEFRRLFEWAIIVYQQTFEPPEPVGERGGRSREFG
jgi:hypothetical protein